MVRWTIITNEGFGPLKGEKTMIEGLAVPTDVFIQRMVHTLITKGMADYEVNYIIHKATYNEHWDNNMEANNKIDERI